MFPLGIVPALFFCAIGCRQRQQGQPFRDSVIRAGVITGVWVAAGTELLSLVHALSFWPLLLWWSIPTIIIAHQCRRGPLPRLWPFPQDNILRLLLAASGLLLAITFVGAAFAPPNNWDVLTYHLPRQVYWMQQHSVANFPTNDLRMLAMPPLAEFAGLHLMILSGGDHWSSLIQWLAFVLTALAASTLARELGCSSRLQATAALLVLTVPPAAMQSMSAKNDVVVAFFFCALVFEAVKIYQTRDTGLRNIALVAAACGLLVLAKGTGMIFGLVAAVWIAATFFSRMPWKRALACGAFAGLIVLFLNVGHLLRVQIEFNSQVVTKVVVNRLHTLQALASNVARNAALHLATPSAKVNTVLERGVTTLHGWIDLDVNDPLTTFRLQTFSIRPYFSNEDRSTAPIHLLLAIAALVPITSELIRGRDKILATCLLLPYAGYLLFCWLLAWQPWGSRLEVPLFCLAAPVIASTLGKRLPRLVGVSTAFAFALAVFSVLTVQTKPFVGQRSFLKRPSRARYFRNDEARPGLSALRNLCRTRKPATVGVFSPGHRCEYLLFWSLLHGNFPPPRFVNMNATVGKSLSPAPPLDIVVGWHADPGGTNASFNQTFTLATNAGAVVVYLPRR